MKNKDKKNNLIKPCVNTIDMFITNNGQQFLKNHNIEIYNNSKLTKYFKDKDNKED
jgi:hypothetical protein